MLNLIHLLSVAWLLLAIVRTAPADVTLPAIFSDHMVLQRDRVNPIWGRASPGEMVTVKISSQSATATADADGRWSTSLGPLPAGGPHALTVTGRNSVTAQDILVGEVWLCSGQSNMAMTVNRAANFETEQAAANHSRVRQFKVAMQYAGDPQAECQGSWAVCSPQTVAGFSATAYFFARELSQTLQVPVGIVNASVGGTPIEAWISESAQRSSPELRESIAQLDASRAAFNPEQARAQYETRLAKWREDARAARAAGQTPPRAPQDPVAQFERKSNCGGLFNGMIAPVIGYGFRGALWYQGEANTIPEKAPLYQPQLELLVVDWRSRHTGEEFPFAWVQLPGFRGAGRNWPLVREAMLKATRLPNTGTAVTIDVGESSDIHPKNKQSVGKRLALWALTSVYGQSHPLPPVRYAVESTAGGSVLVRAEPAAALTVDDGEASIRFAAVAGVDRQWKPARVEIVDGGKLRFSSSEVPQPVAARYQWSNDPPARCIRVTGGLPISPFRTDDWDSVAPFDQ